MPRKKKSGSAAWADPDDAPELTDAFFDRAEIRQGNRVVRRGRPPLLDPKQAVKLRLDADVLAAYRKTGAGWQTRINADLRKARKLKARKTEGGVRRTHPLSAIKGGSRVGKGHKDKVAVITGGANGIGQAFAKRLAEDGVHIAVADMVDGRETVNLVEAAGRNALAVVCDVSSPNSVAAMAKQVQQKFGRADIVVNCAGIYPQVDFAAMTFADWRKVLSINLDGTFLVTAAFVPGMRARKWGRIVNLASSTFGSVTTGFAHYVASKGGIIGFTRAIAGDVAADGITVNAIAPGLTRSPGTLVRKPRPGFATMDDEFTAVAGLQAIKRIEVPEDLVGALSFLTSDDAAFMTGQTLNVDGGRVRS